MPEKIVISKFDLPLREPRKEPVRIDPSSLPPDEREVVGDVALRGAMERPSAARTSVAAVAAVLTLAGLALAMILVVAFLGGGSIGFEWPGSSRPDVPASSTPDEREASRTPERRSTRSDLPPSQRPRAERPSR